MTVARDLKRKYDLLRCLAGQDKTDIHALQETTGIPVQTIYRQIAILRTDFGMTIEYVREQAGQRGNKGYYVISDWGIVDKAKFLNFWTQPDTLIAAL